MGSQKDLSKCIGDAGELWFAATFQRVDQGYRVSTVDIDDTRTDLFLFKVKKNTVESIYRSDQLPLRAMLCLKGVISPKF